MNAALIPPHPRSIGSYQVPALAFKGANSVDDALCLLDCEMWADGQAEDSGSHGLCQGQIPEVGGQRGVSVSELGKTWRTLPSPM